MGGLGNGRRGGRSPPLLIAALIACILVLGFNYWVSSSRNLELQTKLYELEGQVRRGAAERGVAEMKKTEFQEEIQRQKEQISHIENLYKTQLEGAQTSCSQDKVLLQQNISSSTKTIQELKGQLNQLNDNVGQLQKELQSCQSSLKTLDNKLTYDMTHCNSQVLSQKELCEERVAAAKLEAQKKIDKLLASQMVNVDVLEKASSNETKLEHTQSPSQTRDQTKDQTKDQTRDQPSDLLSNSILETNEVAAVQTSDHVLSKQTPVSAPTGAAGKQDLPPPPVGAEEATKALENNTTDDKEMELMDTKDESHTDDPGMEDMLLTEGKADEEEAQKVDLQDEYDTDQEMAPEKQQPSKRENLDQEEEDLADYNGDDENEGEFEADKQAALAQT